MKKTYEKPVLELIHFSTEDVLGDSNLNSQYVHNVSNAGNNIYNAGDKTPIKWAD